MPEANNYGTRTPEQMGRAHAAKLTTQAIKRQGHAAAFEPPDGERKNPLPEAKPRRQARLEQEVE